MNRLPAGGAARRLAPVPAPDAVAGTEAISDLRRVSDNAAGSAERAEQLAERLRNVAIRLGGALPDAKGGGGLHPVRENCIVGDLDAARVRLDTALDDILAIADRLDALA